ncbi:MAG: TIGR03790 family protein [Thermodesulfobacteriota bacterium]
MIPSHRRCRQSCLILLLAWLALAVVPSGALALSARDLIVVYNRNVVESQAVAAYYAEKRNVPVENLVGVEVSTSEDMSRQEFDEKLAPPVRALVNRLKAQARTPAILLVYGIPLRVGPTSTTKADQAFKELTVQKVNEYQRLVLQLVVRLDRLTPPLPGLPGKPDWHDPGKKPYSPREILAMAHKSFLRGMAYLQKQPAGDAPTRKKVMSLLIKLGGTSPEARALMERIARSQGKERQALQQQELLGWDAVMSSNVQEEMFRGILPKSALDVASAIRFSYGLIGELKFWDSARSLYEKRETAAAVDSEMTLIMGGPYQTAGWLPNPFNLGYNRWSVIDRVKARTLMVSRLDGPTPAIARRLVDDALEVEKIGLNGTFYLDARGLTGQVTLGNYTWFDQHLVRLYDLIKKYSDMKVVLDKKPEVFAPDSCPDAALYCGWYSVGNYVPAFKWTKGAVGYHVASHEAGTLRQPGRNVWCKRMLEEGVAATLGPVNEPYLHTFPLPDQFFPLLMTGKGTLLEVYFLTIPQISWMQVLIGDPLYCPFKKNPAIRPAKGQEALTPEKN